MNHNYWDCVTYLPFLSWRTGIRDPGFYSPWAISTKTAFSAIFFEKSVQVKDPGNRKNGAHKGVRKGGVDTI
jgi:hypothetical protein